MIKKTNQPLSEEAIKNWHNLFGATKTILKRLLEEGYTLNDGILLPPCPGTSSEQSDLKKP